MKATITDIDQRYSLATKAFKNLLTLHLESGVAFQVEVGDDIVQAILSESEGEKPTDIVATSKIDGSTTTRAQLEQDWADAFSSIPKTTDVQIREEPQYPHHVSSGVVEWEKLPDTQLPPSIKDVLRASGLEPTISIEDLDKLKLEVLNRMKARPKAGKWGDGPQRAVAGSSRRTIPMDEAGNPLPPGGIIETDPGETQDEDEDGVQQA